MVIENTEEKVIDLLILNVLVLLLYENFKHNLEEAEAAVVAACVLPVPGRRIFFLHKQ